LRKIILAGLAIALAGCGLYHWHKQGADAAAFQRDSIECQQQSGAAAQPQQGQAPAAAPGASPWEACMNGRGWVYSSGW
jgi:hypothetical protein